MEVTQGGEGTRLKVRLRPGRERRSMVAGFTCTTVAKGKINLIKNPYAKCSDGKDED